MKKILLLIFKIIEILFSPFTILAAFWLKILRKGGLIRETFSGKIFSAMGILPVVDHYYEPMASPHKHLKTPLRQDRLLPGIDLNEAGQLALLEKFNYNDELLKIPLHKKNDLEYYYDNNVFAYGDGEFLYNIIRHIKPLKIIEVGGGNSTKLIYKAMQQNQTENAAYKCEHICIEPYEQPWLEKLNTTIVRKKVEDIDISFFKQLQENDILFIDSSHIIRPQGDVLFEYLTILPVLNPGVIVHIHDIFTPKDYLDRWIYNYKLLWNEQYLLEAFLTLNKEFEIIGALNFLKNHHTQALGSKCPVLAQYPDAEPASFWMRRKQ